MALVGFRKPTRTPVFTPGFAELIWWSPSPKPSPPTHPLTHTPTERKPPRSRLPQRPRVTFEVTLMRACTAVGEPEKSAVETRRRVHSASVNSWGTSFMWHSKILRLYTSIRANGGTSTKRPPDEWGKGGWPSYCPRPHWGRANHPSRVQTHADDAKRPKPTHTHTHTHTL